MRKYEKKTILDLLETLREFHEEIKKQSKNQEILFVLFSDALNFIVAVKKYILLLIDSQASILDLVDKYEKVLIQSMERISLQNADMIEENLNRILTELYEEVNVIKPDKIEVLFLPYKVSMADSLESIWKAALSDQQCNVSICPIPYYDILPNCQVGQMHYEGGHYDKSLPLVDWKTYSIEERHPDIIFIHNPYDDGNRVTSVHPDFYSSKLRHFTDYLVYVPYFLLPGEFQEHFAMMAGVINSDITIVQNEVIRKGYIETFYKCFPEDKHAEIASKFVALGTPKTDKLINIHKETLNIPEEWESFIDGKKVVFYNTNISMILRNSDYLIENLQRIFDVFNNHPDFTVIWREHPLTFETLQSMRPQLFHEYLELRNEFISKRWGILDETPDAYTAMAISDCYFGSGGSLSALYPVSGKPIMSMSYYYPEQIAKRPITLEQMIAEHKTRRLMYLERAVNSLDLFLDNLAVFEAQKDERIALQSTRTFNLDGTVGQKIYDFVKRKVSI